MATTISGLTRVAAAVPRVKLGDVRYNTAQTIKLARQAARDHVALTVFPELGLTGYTLGDLVQQPTLLDAASNALVNVAEATAELPTALVVGLPVRIGGKLYNTGAVIAGGQILGLVPKSYLPNYQEFYEGRWFTAGTELAEREIAIGGHVVPIGTDLLFKFEHVPGLTLGVEICEDLWAPVPPSARLTVAGATVIANLSASNELADKARYRRHLVEQQSARTRSAYIYTSCGVGESTTDVVFSGHALIAENGQILTESRRFLREDQLICQDIDLEHLAADRVRSGTFKLPAELITGLRTITSPLQPDELHSTVREFERLPFVPAAGAERDARTAEIFQLQSTALASRLEQTGIKHIVLGLSGGLDSTLALLVAVDALEQLGLPSENLHAITMPAHATSDRTKSQAERLAAALDLKLEEIPIDAGARQQLRDIGHDSSTQDVTYENAQARYRTMLLLGRANQIGGLVLGTGDLSEIALGWATFNGDHISHYHVNAGVPKTLVRHLISWVAQQTQFKAASDVLNEVLGTTISPELTSSSGDGIDQSTEDIIGPYELTDFFLYHFVRWGSAPTKILALADTAFAGDYTRAELKYWLQSFLRRFFAAQWKRSVMPDGPKVGSVALSPRGDWRMPSAISSEMWINELQ